MPVSVNLAGEGPTDIEVMRRLLAEADLACGTVYHGGPGRRTGKQNLDRAMPGYIAAARFHPWFVLRDLDDDGCVVTVRNTLLGDAPPGRMVFGIAVRSVDAWLMADREGLAAWLHVDPRHLPSVPEDADDPKDLLFRAAGKSRSSIIRQSVSERALKNRKISAALFDTMIGFVRDAWSPEKAALNSDSLRRTRRALASL